MFHPVLAEAIQRHLGFAFRSLRSSGELRVFAIGADLVKSQFRPYAGPTRLNGTSRLYCSFHISDEAAYFIRFAVISNVLSLNCTANLISSAPTLPL